MLLVWNVDIFLKLGLDGEDGGNLDLEGEMGFNFELFVWVLVRMGRLGLNV